jgi:cytochrome bd-type quinol oxidase subunit 2
VSEEREGSRALGVVSLVSAIAAPFFVIVPFWRYSVDYERSHHVMDSGALFAMVPLGIATAIVTGILAGRVGTRPPIAKAGIVLALIEVGLIAGLLLLGFLMQDQLTEPI